jgi:hypothetical protein
MPREVLSAVDVALVDAAIDSYVDWRERSAAVRRAYRWWRAADTEGRPAAFAAYRAALDREERAVARYRHAIESCASLPVPVTPERPRSRWTAIRARRRRHADNGPRPGGSR